MVDRYRKRLLYLTCGCITAADELNLFCDFELIGTLLSQVSKLKVSTVYRKDTVSGCVRRYSILILRI